MQLIHQDPTGANLIIGVLFNTDNDVTHSSMQVHIPPARPPSVSLCSEISLLRYAMRHLCHAPYQTLKGAGHYFAQVLTVELAHCLGQDMLNGFPMAPATPPTVRPSHRSNKTKH